MNIITKGGREATLCRYTAEFADKLLLYLNGLSGETCRRFGPHAFSEEGIRETFNDLQKVYGFIGLDAESQRIVAYSLIMTGCPEQDNKRYTAYGIHTEELALCTFAPSVADSWQSSGLGSLMFDYIKQEISQYGFNVMILWGGVQASNVRAVNFYTRHGFVAVGGFEHNGNNIDMICYL